MTRMAGLTALATMQAPAAPLPPPHGDDDHVHLGLLLEDLEGLGRDPSDQERLVAGVHIAVPVLVGELLAVLARLVKVAAAEHELGPEAAHGGHLDGVRVLGHADRHWHGEQVSGVGERLAVVPGRGGDDPTLPLLRAELREQVDSASHLERPDRLVVLVLDEDIRLEQLVQGGVAEERGRAEVRRDSESCLQHVRECRNLPPHHAAILAKAR